jgi:hypothetical protein
MTIVEHLFDFPPEMAPRDGETEAANLVIDSAWASGNGPGEMPGS